MFHPIEQIPGTTEMCLKYTVLFTKKKKKKKEQENKEKVAVLHSFDDGYNTSLSSLHVSIHSY